MKFKKPNFWDYKEPNFIAYLLSPLSLIVKINNLILNIKPKKKFKNCSIGPPYLELVYDALS